MSQSSTTIEQQQAVRDRVRRGYADIAKSGPSCGDQTHSCCTAPVTMNPTALAHNLGYRAEDLSGLPDQANLGLSCGNPNALAALQPGEVVLDLGSGGGFDVFIAGRKVGPTGRVIGVDMTAEMISKARHNATAYHRETGLNNVEFRLGEIEHLPVADGSVDVIISNCVINLSPDKPQVWREMARVLKSGGRVAVSDLALLRPLPEAVRTMAEALVGCIAGAELVTAVEQMAREAGLVAIKLTPRTSYVTAMLEGNDPLYRRITEQLPADAGVADFVTSLEIEAQKPAASCCGEACCAS